MHADIPSNHDNLASATTYYGSTIMSKIRFYARKNVPISLLLDAVKTCRETAKG